MGKAHTVVGTYVSLGYPACPRPAPPPRATSLWLFVEAGFSPTNPAACRPYYISPELAQGKPYDKKADIWSLGCVAYELATGHRTFEGSNLPALVRKIMRGEFAPIEGPYTDDLRDTIASMLNHDPEKRPTCKQLLEMPLFRQVDTEARPLSRRSLYHRGLRSSHRRHMQSVIFHWTTEDMSPLHIEFGRRFKIVQVACGLAHCLALNDVAQVFAWGSATHGQLGTGTTQPQAQPVLVPSLMDMMTKQVAAGGHCSAFVSATGVLSTCGRADHGGLGIEASLPRRVPQAIESLLGCQIKRVAVGHEHMAAITEAGELYAWGTNSSGQLGLPGLKGRQALPQRVALPDGIVGLDVFCGPDATALLTSPSRLLACGNNANNKLGLNPRFGLLSRKYCETADSFQVVKLSGKGIIESVSLGATATCIVMSTGKCYVMGNNQHGILGTGGPIPSARLGPTPQAHAHTHTLAPPPPHAQRLSDMWDGAAGNFKARDFPASVKHVLCDYQVQQCAVGENFVLVSACDQELISQLGGCENVPQDVFAWGCGLINAPPEDEEAQAFTIPNWISLAASPADVDSANAEAQAKSRSGSRASSGRRSGSTHVMGEQPFVTDMAVDGKMIVLVLDMPLPKSTLPRPRHGQSTEPAEHLLDLDLDHQDWTPMLTDAFDSDGEDGGLPGADDTNVPLWLQEELDATRLTDQRGTQHPSTDSTAMPGGLIQFFPPRSDAVLTIVDQSAHEVVDPQGNRSRPLRSGVRFPARPPLITPPRMEMPRPPARGHLQPLRLERTDAGLDLVGPVNEAGRAGGARSPFTPDASEEAPTRPQSAQTLTLFPSRRIRLSRMPKRAAIPPRASRPQFASPTEMASMRCVKALAAHEKGDRLFDPLLCAFVACRLDAMAWRASPSTRRRHLDNVEKAAAKRLPPNPKCAALKGRAGVFVFFFG
jgi:hypothetical protein